MNKIKKNDIISEGAIKSVKRLSAAFKELDMAMGEFGKTWTPPPSNSIIRRLSGPSVLIKLLPIVKAIQKQYER